MTSKRLALLVLALAPCVAAQPAATPAISPADSLARKLESIRRPAAGRAGARVVEVTEDELAAYLNSSLRLPKGVSGLGVRLDRDRLVGSGTVDLEQVRHKLPPNATSGMFNPLSYLSGTVPAEFSGKLDARDGFARFALESVSLGPVRVPVAVVEQIVASSTKNADNPDGVDIHAPFRLPYAIRRVRLQPGRALIEF